MLSDYFRISVNTVFILNQLIGASFRLHDLEYILYT